MSQEHILVMLLSCAAIYYRVSLLFTLAIINFMITQKSVFEGVAHEALAECVYSLQFASDSIKAKKVWM